MMNPAHKILQTQAKEIFDTKSIATLVKMDRYIDWPIFLADTDISVSVLIISVLARTISVLASMLKEILVSVFNRYRS